MKALDRRRLTTGAVALALAAILVWVLWPSPEPVDIVEVTRGPLVVTLDEEGETRVRERFVVSAPVAGRLLRIELEPGDPVVAGETVLAVLQPREATLLDRRSRAEAEAQVHALEAELERARHEGAQAEAELEFAVAEHARAQRLSAGNVLSAEELDAAKLAETRAREAVEAAAHAIEGAAYRLTSARARLLDAGNPGRRGDDPISLHAPIDGVVLRLVRESESVVLAGEPLLEVGNAPDLEIVADYLSSDAVKIRPGARVWIERWGSERPLEGRVRRVEPSGFTKISALGVEEKRVNVIIDLIGPPEEREGLADGFRVETRVVSWESDDTVQLSAGALFRRGEGWAVFVVDKGRAQLRAVEVGARTPAAVEILAGLEPGERVIDHPRDAIADGARVAPRTLPY
jgi:HlyD family secretion protein